MTTAHAHPHAEFDRYPALLDDLAAEFGPDGLLSVAARIITAEEGDFLWESRIAEIPLGPAGDLGDDNEEEGERVAILSVFQGRYHVALCVVDAQRRLCWAARTRHFDQRADAEQAFLAAR
ncbi:hypothetical protein KXS07_10535 [Inquilinus limosus]|uniref:hypothetical protein n=1 Tax=Inquilinus limosus TaxID=171674 RepID=UPI003F166F87